MAGDETAEPIPPDQFGPTEPTTLRAVWEQVSFTDGVYTVRTNGVEWTFTVFDGDVSLGGGLDVPAVSPKRTGALSVPSSLAGLPVIAIGEDAFRGCADLQSISLPAGLEDPKACLLTQIIFFRHTRL